MLGEEYTLDNAHFYCETADLTRPFPSAAPVAAPSWEFVWNNWLSAALREEGLGAVCPPLLQVRTLNIPGYAGVHVHCCTQSLVPNELLQQQVHSAAIPSSQLLATDTQGPLCIERHMKCNSPQTIKPPKL